MSKGGRSEILDAMKRGQILAILGVGGTRTMAAKYVGCATSTIRCTAERHAEFAEKLDQAETVSAMVHLKNINNAGSEPQYWRASAWALEKLHPEYFPGRNLENATLKQVRQLIRRFMDALMEEVPVERYRKAMRKRMEEIVRSLQEES